MDKTIVNKILKVIIITSVLALIISPFIVFNIVREIHDRDADTEAKDLYSFCSGDLINNYEYYRDLSELLLKEYMAHSPEYADVDAVGVFTDIDIKNASEIEYSRSERTIAGYHFIEVSVLYTESVPDNDYEHIIGDFYGRYMSDRSNVI